jgi:hypothetical protein
VMKRLSVPETGPPTCRQRIYPVNVQLAAQGRSVMALLHQSTVRTRNEMLAIGAGVSPHAGELGSDLTDQ